jgi:hypothetical protein
VSELLLDSQKEMMKSAVLQCTRAVKTSSEDPGSMKSSGYKGLRRRSSILPGDGGRKMSFETRVS